MEKYIKKSVYVYSESLCCTAEMNTILWINCTLIKNVSFIIYYFFKIHDSHFYCCRWVGIHIYKFSFQITVIGRYGSTNARAKIPLGFYYGHTYILPWESELKLMHDPLRGEGESANQPEIDQHLAMMVALQEDIQCRLVENWCIF